MKSTLRNRILNSVSKQLDELSLQDINAASSDEPLGNIIQFIKQRWNINTTLYYSETLSAEDLFESNRLHLREVETTTESGDPSKLVGNMLLLITEKSGSLVQYQSKGKKLFFDPVTNSTIENIDESILTNLVDIIEVLIWQLHIVIFLITMVISQ